MIFDGLRAQEELGGGLLVTRLGGDRERNSELLWGELVEGARLRAPNCRAARTQLLPRPVGPRRRAQRLEDLECGVELEPCVPAGAVAAPVLAMVHPGSSEQ